jgi:hypothetical protein
MITKMAMEKTMQRMSFFCKGSLARMRIGSGMHSIITSDEMLKTVFTIRWS